MTERKKLGELAKHLSIEPLAPIYVVRFVGIIFFTFSLFSRTPLLPFFFSFFFVLSLVHHTTPKISFLTNFFPFAFHLDPPKNNSTHLSSTLIHPKKKDARSRYRRNQDHTKQTCLLSLCFTPTHPSFHFHHDPFFPFPPYLAPVSLEYHH